MLPEPLVGVVLVNFNGRTKTLACLDSLQDSDYSNLRIVVIENGSPDPSKAMTSADIASYDNATLISERRNLGFTGGVNLGIRYAIKDGWKYTFLLNNDSAVPSDCISNLVRCAEERPNSGCISPVVMDVEKTTRIRYAGGSVGRYTKLHHYARRIPSSAHGPYKTQLCDGAAMLLRTDAINEIGLFDETLFLYCEDSDVSLRLQKAGYDLFVDPDVRILHEISGVYGERLNPISVFFPTRNYFIVTRKNHSPMEAILATFLFGVYRIPYMACVYVATRRARLIRPFILGILWHAGYNRNTSDANLVIRMLDERRRN